MDLTPTTELSAVNTMLRVIGQTRVSSLEGTLGHDALEARNTLSEISREVQTTGWHFNTETDYPLPRNTEGKIPIPQNALNVDIDPSRYFDYDVVARGAWLYDKKSHSYTFPEDLSAEIVFLLPFEELPEAARRYITIRAARIFQDTEVTEKDLHVYTSQDEAMARIALSAMEAENADANILDNTAVRRITRRM